MHPYVILCFAVLIWWPGERPFTPPLSSSTWIWLAVWLQVPAFLLAAGLVSTVALRRLNRGTSGAVRAQSLLHWGTVVLRTGSVFAFLAALFLTKWIEAVGSIEPLDVVPGLVDLVVITPFFAVCTAIFIGLFPIDRAIHQAVIDARAWEGRVAGPRVWNRRQYLNFNLRHHLLVVAVPMTLVLVAFDLARDHEDLLVDAFNVQWAAEAAPGLAAGVVFIFAPLMLRRIWSTRPLPDGPLRRALQAICDRIGLPYRDILIWHSGGMMVNAAVMGLFRQVRYVMLSDGLLEAMSTEQIQAVFGHEAGHVRHRHIQFFLLFAVCSMLVLSAVIEALRLGAEAELFDIHVLTMQGFGLLAALLFWGIGFGWISRRFERQADLFGAHCVTPPDPDRCRLPCSVHGDEPGQAPPPSAVCATAAAVFASALDRVAVLNGIPHEERNWRHSSIGSRVRFLTALSGDPARAHRFARSIRRIKRVLLVTAVGGSIVAGVYVWDHPIYGVGLRVAPGATGGTATARQTYDHEQETTDHVRPDHRRPGRG